MLATGAGFVNPAIRGHFFVNADYRWHFDGATDHLNSDAAWSDADLRAADFAFDASHGRHFDGVSFGDKADLAFTTATPSPLMRWSALQAGVWLGSRTCVDDADGERRVQDHALWGGTLEFFAALIGVVATRVVAAAVFVRSFGSLFPESQFCSDIHADATTRLLPLCAGRQTRATIVAVVVAIVFRVSDAHAERHDGQKATESQRFLHNSPTSFRFEVLNNFLDDASIS